NPPIKGDAFTRVDMGNNTKRGGLLTQATFLAATSKGTEPIIPRRGKWVLVNLLCNSTPPPPVDAIAREMEIEKTLGPNPTRRQIADARMATQPWGTCHARFDPIGLALDNYDVTGAWRAKDGTQPIDTSGLKLADGSPILGPRLLERLLRDDP